MTDLRDLRERIATAPVGDLAAVIGQLEELKATAWARLTAPVMLPTSTPTGLVDAARMAGILGTPENWVRDKARAGALPFVRLGHYMRFEPAVVVEAVRQLRLQHNGRLRRVRKHPPKQHGATAGVHRVSKTSDGGERVQP